MIVTNYAGFIKNNQLQVDTSINLFVNNGDTLGGTNKINKFART
jgi:hypothetical protein